MVVGAKFCPECGAPAAEPTGQRPAGVPPPPPPPQAAAAGGGAPAAAPAAAGAGAKAGLEPPVARLLCYLATWLTGLIFLNLEPYKHDPDIKFHSWQAIFFGIAWVAAAIAFWIIMMIFLSIGLWSIFWILRLAFWGGSLAIWILLMVKAYNGGDRFKLPIIGDLAEQQAAK
jgi:uncharacterized membrane protein